MIARRPHWTAGVAVVAAFVVSASIGTSTPVDAGAQISVSEEAVTFRYQSGASFGQIAAFELADHFGYYDGTSVQLDSVGVWRNGPEDIQAIAAGSIDVALANTAPLINANVAGIEVKAILPFNTTLTRSLDGETISAGGLLVTRDGGIAAPEDLEGKTVSVNVRSAQAEYAIRQWMQENGADPDTIEYVVIAPPNEVQSLQQGQIDAAYTWSPAYNVAQEDPNVTVLATEGDMLDDFVVAVYALSDDFLDTHPQAVREFAEGYVRAWAWAWEHPAEWQDVAAELIELFDGDPSLARYVFPFGSRDHALIQDSDIQFYIDRLAEAGELDPSDVEPGYLYTN
jgi:ABC-type nitrate/sulfonate/bicarbonate transport system substrate-binding protein